MSVVTDLTVTGRVAQFGRGVMADVSSKLLGQFADCLENKLLVAPDASGAGDAGGPAPVVPAATTGTDSGGVGHGPLDLASEGAAAAAAVERAGQEAASARSAGSAGEAAATSGPAVRVIDSPQDVEPVDLLEAAGAPVAKRAIPVVAGLTFLWLVSIFLRRRRRKA